MEMKPGKYLVCVNRGEVSRVALRFACRKALKRGGLVEMLYVIPPADMQNLFGVVEKVREEQRNEAETLIKALTEIAMQTSGVAPTVQIREGKIGEEIINATLEDTDINMVVLGAAPEKAGKGNLLTWLAGKLGDRMLVPLMLVPGNLTDLQIEELS